MGKFTTTLYQICVIYGKYQVGKYGKSFVYIKQVVARGTLLSYLDFNERCYIHTDAINIYLGSVIIQEDKPINIYSCKGTGMQTQYKVTENKLIIIV